MSAFDMVFASGRLHYLRSRDAGDLWARWGLR